MGDRGQIHIKDSGVWLYTHWGATELPDILRRALARKQRWSDDEYLARIIFSEMIRDEINEETGYGIGKGQHTDVNRVLEVDCQNQQVKMIIGDTDSWIERAKEHGFDYSAPETRWVGSFEDFINSNVNWYEED